MRVHNVTALQHDVDKISSLSVLDACKSTSVNSVHKHFSEISAMPCRNNKLCSNTNAQLLPADARTNRAMCMALSGGTCPTGFDQAHSSARAMLSFSQKGGVEFIPLKVDRKTATSC